MTTPKELTAEQRSELIEKLCGDTYQSMCDDSRFGWSMLRTGFKGYEAMTDTELLQRHVEAFDEDYLADPWGASNGRL